MSVAPRPRSRRGEGALLRAEILDAAQGLLAETASEDAVSIRAVAERVGVTPPSIYRHFTDKDRLLLEVCHRSFDQFAGALEGPAAAADPVARMLALGRAYVHYALAFPEHYRIMFMARFELSAQEYAEEMIRDESTFAVLLRTSQDLIDAGLVRPGLAGRGALHVGIMFWSAVHGLSSLFVAKPGLPWPDQDQLVEDLVGVAVRGITIADP